MDFIAGLLLPSVVAAAFAQDPKFLKASIKAAKEKADEKGLRPYDLSVRTQFKIPEALLSVTQDGLKRVWIGAGTLNAYPEDGKYLLSGQIRAGGIELESIPCRDWIEPWETVSQRHKAALRKQRLTQGCQCHIAQVKGKLRCENGEPKMGESVKMEQCHWRHSFCTQRPDGTCHWANSPQLKACLG